MHKKYFLVKLLITLSFCVSNQQILPFEHARSFMSHHQRKFMFAAWLGFGGLIGWFQAEKDVRKKETAKHEQEDGPKIPDKPINRNFYDETGWNKSGNIIYIYENFIDPQEELESMKIAAANGLAWYAVFLVCAVGEKNFTSWASSLSIIPAIACLICTRCAYRAYIAKNTPKEIFMTLSKEGIKDNENNYFAWKNIVSITITGSSHIKTLTLGLDNGTSHDINLTSMAPLSKQQFQKLLDETTPSDMSAWKKSNGLVPPHVLVNMKRYIANNMLQHNTQQKPIVNKVTYQDKQVDKLTQQLSSQLEHLTR